MSIAISAITTAITGSGLNGGKLPAATTVSGKPGEFASVLNGAVQRVEQYRAQASQAVEGMLNGDGGELHNVALATQRAELAFELGLQMRNKVVAAYQEIMRMQL